MEFPEKKLEAIFKVYGSKFIVPTFGENGIFMLCVVFYSVNFHRSK